MRPYTKMMLLQEGENENETERARREYERAREETDRARMEYDRARSERSGTRGVSSDGYSYPIYPSSRDWRGREWTIRENRGDRYTPQNIGYPGVPPIFRSEYGGEENERPMQKIGFAVPDEMDGYGYGMRYDYPQAHEMPYREEMPGDHHSPQHGYAMGASGMGAMDKKTAVEWCKEMENEDGTRGAHWSMEQTKQIMEQHKIKCDPVEFYVAMNMMYSDYCGVAKAHGVSTADFYADMAKAFLDDKDAHKDKLSRYYDSIVK